MKHAIIISGGLGNQMFQYAFLLAMQKTGIKIDMNASLYHYNRMHNGYMLNKAFGISCNDEYRSSRFRILWTRAIRQRKLPFLLYQEDESRFCNDAFTTRKPYLDGVWINPSYFNDIEDEVRKTFVFIGLDNRNLILAAEMQSCNSISLHIRRGDYLMNSMYNVCDEEYYHKAIEYIRENMSSPLFYVFSDDPAWCETFMKKLNVSFKIVDNNTNEDSYKDMFLMTQCRHNIIANSTFSWWGAWLGRQENKIVICPDRWINGRDFNPCLTDWYHIK